MFRLSSPQRPLFGVEHRLDAVKRGRLERSWAHQYREKGLPLIDEGRFAKFFDDDNGRPNKPVRLVTSVLLFKEVWDLTDAEALAELEWNMLWHYALDITPEEAHTCQKTLHNTRVRLVNDDEGASLFEGTTARLIEAAGLQTHRQRQDSTHIVSNIKILTRLGLFVRTLTQFLEALRKQQPSACEGLPEELRARYLDREGYFADARGSEAPRRLKQAALDVFTVLRAIEGNAAVMQMESFTLVKRLFDDQCVAPKAKEPKRIELNEKPSSSSLQSPSDPDVTYGHKGKGYEVQLTETCVPENPFQAVTAASVNGANESDQHQVQPALEQTERTCGEAPEELHTDAGYGSGANIVEAREHGTELKAPIGAKESEKHLSLGEFTLNEAGDRVLTCPTGAAPVRQGPTKSGKKVQAWFGACQDCPLKSICPTQKDGRLRRLTFDAETVAVARRRAEQETSAFKERHKIRSGIEATNSELKRCHGLRKLRVRRRPRVALAVRLKALALNMKRYMTYLCETASAGITAPAYAG